MARVYLSLGSNIDPQKNLSSALIELREQFGVLVVSPVYRCVAIGFEGPDFLNLAVGLDTEMPVLELSDWLHELENRHGRDRSAARFSSRTLDVDIVLYDDLVMRGSGNLELPRPELKHAFVLKPLADIAPKVVHPVLHKTLAQLWQEFPKQEVLTVEMLQPGSSFRMSAAELENKYLPHVREVRGLRLFTAETASRLLEDCMHAEVRLIGIEAFRLLGEGRVQPSMEFSNISYGTAEKQSGKIKFTPKLGLRPPWDQDSDALRNSLALIAAGCSAGYDWYEVSLEDTQTEELLFFPADS